MKKNIKSKKRVLFSLKNEFYDALRYIKESQGYIYLVIVLFLMFTVLGFAFHSQLTELDKTLAGIIDQTKDLRGMNLISFIFQNNLDISFLSLFLGVFLGIFPLLSTLSNGIVIGYVLEKVSSISGLSEIWRLFPHGIFELPAVFISLGLGIKLGTFIFAKQKMKELKSRMHRSILVFLLIVVPLLTIAAVIEGLLITFLR